MRKIGFDIGISSIGWAVVDTGESDDKFDIIDCGVRIFEKAENPKDGSSLALPRREARSARRRLARRKARLNAVKRLLCKEFDIKFNDFIMQGENLPKIFATDKNTLNPWQLRKFALERKLDKFELARVILHIAKHRGYDDLRYFGDSDDAESKKVLGAISKNKKFTERGFKTASNMLLNDFEKKEISSIRNRDKDGAGNYENSIPQSLNKEELTLILEKQAEFGYKFSENFAQNLIQKVFYSRPLKDFENKVGKCIFYEKEKRVAKFTPLAQEFIALTKIINTLINIYKDTGEILQQEKIIEILNLAKSKGEFKYKDLVKALNLQNYKIKGSKKDDLSDTFIDFKKYKKFTQICSEKFGGEFCDVFNDKFNEIARICTYKKDFDSLKIALSKYEFDDEQINELLKLKFSTNIELSEKALRQILPLMMSGKRYDEACKEANLTLKIREKSEKLPPLYDTPHGASLTNPVVARAVSEYRKVLNSIIKKHGLVHQIYFELTREVGKNFASRNEAIKKQNENFAKNEAAKNRLEQYGLEINSANILKMKLFIEQNEFCAYSGEKITREDFLDPKRLEVDHILPYSRSFDDSQSNKVLVFISQNQEKKNHTPFECWGNTPKWEFIKNFAEIHYKKANPAKFKKLLNSDFKSREQGFRASNLNDTSYLNRLIMNYTKDYLKFLPIKSENSRHVYSINGGFTTPLRRFLGLEEKNRNTHLHHAQDALIVALCNEKMNKAFNEFMGHIETKKLLESSKDEFGEFDKEKYKEILQNRLDKDERTKKKLRLDDFIHLENFRKNVENAVSKIFVSKPPRKKVTGALHLETVAPKEQMIKEYKSEAGFEMALKTRRIIQLKNGGFVKNDSMPRVDIFAHKQTGKFYGVPIYAMDFALGVLPNRAAVIGKDKNGVMKDWLEMDENYEFKFSLFPNDLIAVQKSGMENPILCYYEGFGIATAQIRVAKHSNNKADLTSDEIKIYGDVSKKDKVEQPSLGIQGLQIFEKMKVSPLGEVGACKFEPRQGVKLKSSPKRKKG
ncbi:MULTISPECIES: type II CRISPR RNA-guided endonuclease Cas9 [unclassified Campylobacter]|uniref:type II CRISPR RNA-guided endonuclease Cas9 n=1 Tax=unclassified Campylobacter TaxID=2593542 RepID=UPI0022E9BA72|nr:MULTISPECIES: type II CRISPR RNA-guided endonuclease Cas9 [unclassified Campylobacter]MDA3055773.1 type II CRISPR RNA-guided endonuclease Cas9 [Campylobacter sp. CN_NA1]MDA3064963.1 type II CRISPR RNA-guided endonuclease Cas9 [Campylobacter sp. CN_NE4]MDA3068629.1 type II CRISPR RNA-guided endonuclease Cas9 [Campylobacter sp. CN_NE3]MDA3082048.1 type II CRISPR RNA-guided endonuclease Cas9 [Campylobacter sp. CN_EL2]MDA3084214.1 type II CRISPR RNA-guided endonuclease Cas9 [Campylobacter sp. C